MPSQGGLSSAPRGARLGRTKREPLAPAARSPSSYSVLQRGLGRGDGTRTQLGKERGVEGVGDVARGLQHRARLLVEALTAAVLAEARGSFARVRLRTNSPEAARFCEATGFARIDEPDATHERWLASP